MNIREMTICDYDACLALWQSSPGVRVTAEDSEKSIAAFLARNPGLSFVCMEEGELLGAAMCGHDGRRGFIYHVAVKPEYRGKHIGTKLAEACMEKLREAGIGKCHVFVVADNAPGNSFWASFFKKRVDIAVYSRDI